jgi:two-component system phosphate regulon sensor histidine kinase PhoR
MKSIIAKYIAFLSLTALVSILTSGLISISILNKKHQESMEERLSGLTAIAAALAREIPEERLRGAIDDAARILSGEGEIRLTVIKADGTVAADSAADADRMDNHLGRPEIAEAAAGRVGFASRTSDTVKIRYMYAARKSVLKNGEVCFVRVAAPMERVESAARQARASMITAAVFTFAAALIAVAASSIMFTAPVRRLTEMSAKISAGDFSARSAVRGDNEFGTLGRSMDSMAESIERDVAELKRARDDIENILRGMRDGVIVVDSGKRIILINEAVEEIFRVECRNSAGKPLVSVLRLAALNDGVDAVLADGASREIEIETDPIEGTVIDARIFPFRGGGADAGAIIAARDITRLKKLEIVRREFIENASHELRTPVAVIRGFVETLLAGASKDTAALDRFLHLLEKESIRLANLTEDILSLERAESKRASDDAETFDAATLLRDCVSSFDLFIFGEGLKLETDFPPEPAFVNMSKQDFRQIFVNLIDNAVKFTDKGVIRLKIRRAERDVEISVSDTGIGVPARDIERVFERFYRVDKSRSRERGGTGLGLSIVKHLAEKWGGSAAVESKLGVGSTFTVVLPASR